MKNRFSVLIKDPVMLISGILALLSTVLTHPGLSCLSAVDWRVLALLFSLMCVTKGFQETGLFRLLSLALLSGRAEKSGETARIFPLRFNCRNTRQLTAVLVFLCFFMSMLITNDVALITFVPFAILLLNLTGQQQLLIPVVVLQTLAANLGSMLTPIGNPQNLYLYSLSGMSFSRFVLTMLPCTLLSGLLLALSLFLLTARPVHLPPSGEPAALSDRRKPVMHFLLFLLCLGCVLHLLPWQAMLAVTVCCMLLFDRSILKKVDYGLLVTFLFFFLFIGNIQRLPGIAARLGEIVAGRELPVGAAVSQLISNVPAALLLSGFTSDYRALLLGVNIGGLGTLIASLASLISYKQYIGCEGCRRGHYLLVFTLANLAFLAILLPAAFLCL